MPIDRMMDEYKTVCKTARAEFTEKKSVFIGTVSPCETEEEARRFFGEVRKEFPDANHHVTAFINREGNIQRFDDDGEPKGTGGIPMMEVLKKESLSGVAAVVTRYFGGILLGAGGLARAYARGVREALAASGIATFVPFDVLEFSADYSFVSKIEYELSARKIAVRGKEFGEKVRFSVLCAADQKEALDAFLLDTSGGKIRTEKTGEEFAEKQN